MTVMDVGPLTQDEIERLREDLVKSVEQQELPEQYNNWEFVARLLATVDLCHRQRREMSEHLEVRGDR